MKKLLIIAAFCVCPLFGLAQATTGYHRVQTALARAPQGGVTANVVPNAKITVTSTATGLAATIYSDPLLTAQITPALITADNSGNYSYYIHLNYCVTETITAPGQHTQTIPNICINGGGGSPGVSSLNSLTGVINLTSTGNTVTITPSGSSIDLEANGGVLLQTNTSNNSSQTTLNFETSTTNSIGLVVTPSNPSGGIEKEEVTGTYSGSISSSQVTTALGYTPVSPTVTSLVDLTTAAGGAFGTAAYDNTGTSGATIPLLNGSPTASGVWTFSASNALVLSAMTGTSCLEEISGIVTATGVACGSGGGGGTNLEINGSSALTTANFSNNTGAGEIDFTNPSGATVNATLHNTTISGIALGNNLNVLTFGTHLASGGSSYNGSANVTITSDATNANTASTIVARDASGNFVAGTITATLNGNATSATSATSATNFTGSLSGDVTGTQSATAVVKINGGSVPGSANLLASNSSSQLVAATAAGVGTVINLAANYIHYSGGSSSAVLGITPVNNAVLVTNGSGVPSESTTLPSGLSATNLSLTTPNLGTPSAGVLTHATGLPAASVLAGALANGMTGTTQTVGDNTTDLATDAFVLANAGSCANALTMNNSGAGASSGAAFNCGTALTLSFNTIGAAPALGLPISETTSWTVSNTIPTIYIFTGSGASNATLPASASGFPTTVIWNQGTAAITIASGGSAPVCEPSSCIVQIGGSAVVSINAAGTGFAAQQSNANGSAFGSLANASTINNSNWSGTVLAAGNGGTGVANTAILTLGSSNQNWATLGTGIVKNTTTTGALSDAAYADVVGLWASGSCSGYLKSDGTCSTPGGSGTVTVVGAGSLTSTALVTGGGTATLQTPSATSTLDASGNLAVAAGGSIGSADTGTPKFTFATNKATFNQPLYLGTTSNQLVLGTSPNLSTLTFPASSGAVTLTFPNTTEYMIGANSDTTTSHVLHATSVAGVGAFSAIAYTDLPTGTGANQVVLGGAITAGGPTGGATSIPVITYNAAGQLTAVTTATPTVATIQGGATGDLVYQSAANTTAFSTDFTFVTHTLTGGSSAILDLSAASVTAGLKIPGAAGGAPTADDFLAFNTTNHTHVWGSNGTTLVGAAAATGTGTSTACSSHNWVSTISGVAAPSCTQPAIGDISGLGTGVATGLANAATGSGAPVLATSPSLVTPALGAATATSLLATGIVDGTAPITITTGTTANLGTTYKSGYTFNQEGTAGTGVTYTLPATAVGLQYCVQNSGTTGVINTGVLTVYPPASSFVILNGTVNTVGAGGTHGVASGGAAGDGACFVAIDATHWEVFPLKGTWTAN